MNNSTGLTTIEEAIKKYTKYYDQASPIIKLKFKCWMQHSDSRNKNGNAPFTYDNYTKHLSNGEIWERVVLNLIDVKDLGGRKVVKEILGIE